MGELEVTAYSPGSGQGKILDAREVEDLFSLLSEFEKAAAQSPQTAPAEFKDRFAQLGLNVEWYSRAQGPGPLFEAKARAYRREGHSLRELLEAIKDFRSAKESGALTDPRQKSVLIVDDDDSLREMLHYTVGKEGFRVDIFANGKEALAEIHKRGPNKLPDLIVLDLMMPEQGGFETLRELQGGEAGRVPVIVATGRFVDDQMDQTLRREPNVVEFFKKPLQPQALAMKIHQVLGTTPLKK